MNKPILILMVGLSGSGKSTKAKELANRYNATIISSDSIRQELYNDINDQTHNDKVFNTLHKRVKELLSKNTNVIVDATNITIKSRQQFMTYNAIKVAYIMRTPIYECVYRDSLRERNVGCCVINNQMKKFQMPFYSEGFRYIIFDRDNVICQNECIYDDIDNMMKGFDQKNPHHKYDLYTHCKECDREVDRHGGTLIDCLIGDWHDIGKLFVQEIKEGGIATYYQHHNVGAYYLLSNNDWFAYTIEQFGKSATLYILAMINYHILPFQWKEEKTKEKWRKIFGNYLYDKLIMFNKCDIIASGIGEKNEEI